MDLEKRIEQLETKMKHMELELTQLRQERREGIPSDAGQTKQAGQAVQSPPPNTGYRPEAGIPQGYAAHGRPGVPTQPFAQPGIPGSGVPEHQQQQSGIPGYQQQQQSGVNAQPYQGQVPYGYGQAQGGMTPPNQPGMNPYAYNNPQRPNIPMQPKPPKDWEHLIARVWLPRIFIVVLLLGVLWGFTAAVTAGYLTEPVRCLLGVVAAVVMYWLGERQIRSRREALGQVLLGGAIGVLILSVFAAHVLYDLIPSGLAFALYILSIALCVFTALRRRSQTLIIIATVAGYLIPFLVHSAHPNAWVFTGYETLFSLAMVYVALRFDFRAAYYVAIGVLHLPLLIGSVAGDFRGSRHVFITAVFVQHAALLAYAFLGAKRRKLDEILSLFPGFGLMALWIYALYPAIGDGIHWRPLMLIAWALIYSLAAFVKHIRSEQSPVFISMATAAWFLWAVDILNHSYSPAAAIVIGTAGLLLGFRISSYMQQITAAAAMAYGVSQTIILAIHDIISAESLSWLILLISLAVLAYFLRRMEERISIRNLPDVLMWVDALLMIIFLTQITNVLTADLTFDLRHLILSAVWAAYAIVVIVCGVLFQKLMVRFAGLALLFLTLVKVIIVDLPGVSVAVRAILFIGLGALGMLVSRFLYKRKNGPAAPPPSDENPIES
ncbi:DUF2339 domain-containing protein [Paenibacillus azoreducens]|uniref:DUF2339 domain-containing protein n=1 Tax=Paenibacillus azoreducens TaxID=116718 RepID=A0A919Y8D0_9BACL|nr:DUF2339 domain-containing protein [Paenibacillus azoreducens]GIO46502.1 hypothetical protein J34TS1_12670 [Paenibacillus azoreducens]